MANRQKRFVQAQVIKQVGARPLKTKRGTTVFKLGGGIFTRRQILASKQRKTRLEIPGLARKLKKSDFGL